MIIGCPTFWTRIGGPLSGLLQLFLCRSQAATLSLYVRKRWSQYPQFIAAEGYRLRRLDLTMSPIAGDIRPLLRFNLGALECLTISYPRNAIQWERSTVEHVTIFDHVPLRLKALAVDNLRDWFPSDQFPALTHLYLSLHSYADHTSSRHLLALLTHTPKLEFLHVKHLAAVVPAWGSPVSMACIRSLVLLSAKLEAAASFLSHLKLPDSVLVRVDRFDAETPDIPIIRLAGVTDSVARLKIVRSFSGEALFVSEGRICGVWAQGRFPSFTGCATEWLQSMITTLPLLRITQLEINIANDDHEFMLREFSRMPSLTALEINFTTIQGARSMLDALSSEAHHLCPVLQSLTLDICVDVDYARHQLHPAEFHRLIESRAHSGHPLSRVVVQLFSSWSTLGRAAPSLSHFETLSTESDAILRSIASRLEPLSDADVFEVRSVDHPAARPHVGLLSWNLYDAERYWDLDDHEKTVWRH